jgi:colicin import membrane protein
VVSLTEINMRKGLTKTWCEAEETRAAEIAAAEAEARRLAEEKAAADAAAAREQEIKRLVLEKAAAEQQARFAELRKQVEAELEQRAQGDAA